MEPQEPAKNDESGGFSSRRISSILKAPRKSAKLPDQEQQEYKVECAKPVEKRRSRRVSFAPANDVLLFSKDVKSVSPARSPLQELTTATAAPTQKRVQVAAAEDRIQPVVGMETLLSAPLHASQQRDKVNFAFGHDFGEKTMLFSTDDAFMDVTHSHTINIANDPELPADISLRDYDVLLDSGERAMTSIADGRSLDMTHSHMVKTTDRSAGLPTGINLNSNVEKKTLSSSLPCLDPEFENFLASVNTIIMAGGASSEVTKSSLAENKTQLAGVDKENHVPTSAPTMLEKSLTSSKTGQLYYGSALCSEDNMSMNITETQTGYILGSTDDVFQCLFPTQEMYSQSDKKIPQMTEMKSKQQSSNVLRSPDPKAAATIDKRVYNVGTEEGSRPITDMTSMKNRFQHAYEKHKIKFDEDDCSEKTVRFTARDAAMDVTQCHTVNINTDFEPQSRLNLDLLPTCGEKTVRFTARDAAMDVTQSHTVNINTDYEPQSNLNLYSLPTCGEKTVKFTARDAAMDVTQSHTVNIATDFEPQSRLNLDLLPTCGEKTVRFTARDAAMDVTQCHTVNINTDFEPQSNLNLYSLPTCGEKTVRFTARDAAMDVTQSHTVNINTDYEPQSNLNLYSLPTFGEKTVKFTASDAALDVTQSHTVNIATDFEPQSNLNLDLLPTCGEKTVRFTARDAALDVTQCHTVNINTDFEPQSNLNLDLLPTCGEKTVRFTARDAAMDVTQCHTVNINTDFEPQSNLNLYSLPTCGEKTVKFTASDAALDVTQSHTVNITTDFEPQSCKNVDILPTCGEKTMRFTASDVAMDVAQCHTVNITTDLEPQSCKNVDILPTCGEKTVKFTASDAALDVTQSHTVNITTDFEPQSCKNVDILPTCGEKTMRFTASDVAMDVAQCHTVNISSSLSDNVLPCQDARIISRRNMDLSLTMKTEGGLWRNRFSSANTLDLGVRNSISKSNDLSPNPVVTKAAAPVAVSSQESVNTKSYLDHRKMQEQNVNVENETPGFVACIVEKRRETVTDCLEDDVNVDMTEPQTSCILGQTCTDELSQCLSSEQDFYPNPDHMKKIEASLQQKNETLEPSNPDCVEITNHPGFIDANETESKKEPELRNETSPTLETKGSSSSVADKDDNTCSRKSRRMSLADLQSKLKRLSTMINTDPDTAHVVVDSCTVPLPQLDHDLDKTSSFVVVEPELEVGLVNTEDETKAQCLTEREQASAATPFNLKTKQLMSRLSVGGFKPKLPQRSKPDPKNVKSVGEHTKTITVNITSQPSTLDNDVSDIYDEELGSYEDVSETLDTRSPYKNSGNFQALNVDEPLEDSVLEEDFISAVHGQKRPFPEDENKMEDEKRIKSTIETPADTVEMELQSPVLECEGNIATAPSLMTQTTDGSDISHTASIRCEATFESTFKHSLFESQLEDYANDGQKKLDDGTITVSEFLKLFSIDFVIHTPRQSILPGRLSSDTDRTSMDLLKDRHIHRPKQMVYETDVLNLTEKVEGLKFRMRDLDKPLRLVNRPLWEEMRSSSEKEVKSFGAKLKEKNNFFRKMSKTQSHEMKEVLYSNLVQANLKEQEKLSGTITKADEMIKSLDDCIADLEREIAAEEKGIDGKPSQKSRQEELEKVTEALAENERRMCEMEMQKKQSSSHLSRLTAETRDLKSYTSMLQIVNEWKLGEKKNNCAVYTFLYETMNLQVVYENSHGNEADNGSEQTVSQISFTFQLDDERSNCHARLIHKLLSQYIEENSPWVEIYPTSRYVPKLLHDVGLVVSRCRLLGEELRLLKMWGGIRLDIVDISCVDTEVCIVFSSLKKLAKFEVVFSVSLINQLYVLKMQSFKNKIGGTTSEQLEGIVSSFSPGTKLLTKIVKKIHDDLLC